jgi:F-type H+-transporting ATPase subunit b
MRPIGLLTAAAMSFFASAAIAAEARGGMPQLDFKNVLLKSQVVWLVIIFSVLYILLSRWALPKVGNVLEKRAATIAGDLNAARQAKTAADAAVAELTTKTQAAHAGAQAEIASAVDTAKAAATVQTATLTARLDAQLAEAEGRINVARTAAMGALRQVASDTAGVVVARLTGVAASSAAVDAAVGAALSARGLG